MLMDIMDMTTTVTELTKTLIDTLSTLRVENSSDELLSLLDSFTANIIEIANMLRTEHANSKPIENKKQDDSDVEFVTPTDTIDLISDEDVPHSFNETKIVQSSTSLPVILKSLKELVMKRPVVKLKRLKNRGLMGVSVKLKRITARDLKVHGLDVTLNGNDSGKLSKNADKISNNADGIPLANNSSENDCSAMNAVKNPQRKGYVRRFKALFNFE